MRSTTATILGRTEAKSDKQGIKDATAAYNHIKQALTKMGLKFRESASDKGGLFVIDGKTYEEIEELVDDLKRHMPHAQAMWVDAGDDYIGVKDPDYDREYR